MSGWRIALEAGLTRNAISNYYASKTELHRAAFSSIAHDALTIIMVDLPGSGEPAMTRIVGLFRAAIRMNDTDSSFVRFWVTSAIDAVHHPQLRDQSDRQFHAVHQFISEAPALGKARGEIAAEVDTRDLAQVVVDLLWGLAMDSGFRSDGPPGSGGAPRLRDAPDRSGGDWSVARNRAVAAGRADMAALPLRV